MRKKQHNNLILRLKVGDPTSQTDFEKPEQEGHAKATHAPVDGVAGLAQIVSTPAGTIGETSTTALEIGDDETEQNGKQKEERHDNGKQREQQYSTPETEKEVYVNDAEGRHSTTAARNDSRQAKRKYVGIVWISYLSDGKKPKDLTTKLLLYHLHTKQINKKGFSNLAFLHTRHWKLSFCKIKKAFRRDPVNSRIAPKALWEESGQRERVQAQPLQVNQSITMICAMITRRNMASG